MSATLAVGGWLAALGVATTGRLVFGRRMELVARACHELRGPLTAAHLAVHVAARGPDAPRAPLRAIDAELGRADLALEDLHAARRGGRPAGRMESFEVGALLAETVGLWQTVVATRGMTLQLDPADRPALVRGDRERLARACANLLANAVEHGGEAVLVRVRAGMHVVRIEVLDDGPGLPAPVMVLIRRPRAGRGLRGRGLAIVAEIAARHGGLLASAPTERGARLVIELPLVPAP